MPTGKQKRAAGNAAKPDPDKNAVYIVSGEGTDEDIRARCEAIPGWSEMSAKVQGEIVRLMRVHWEMAPSSHFRVEQTAGGTKIIRPPESATLNWLRLTEGMASSSTDYATIRMEDLGQYHGSRENLTTETLNASIAFVRGAKAEDTVQSTLAVQMAATHDAAMKALNRIGSSQYVEQVQLFGNLANKLLNTFTRQAEVLAKLQRGGEQTIKHVHIDNRGGQAVVTDTVVSGGLNEKTGHQPDAFGPALLSADPFGSGVPVPGSEGQEALSHAWWCAGVRCTARQSKRAQARTLYARQKGRASAHL